MRGELERERESLSKSGWWIAVDNNNDDDDDDNDDIDDDDDLYINVCVCVHKYVFIEWTRSGNYLFLDPKTKLQSIYLYDFIRLVNFSSLERTFKKKFSIRTSDSNQYTLSLIIQTHTQYTHTRAYTKQFIWVGF